MVISVSYGFVSSVITVTNAKSSAESEKFTLKIRSESVKLLTIGCHFPPKSTNFGTLFSRSSINHEDAVTRSDRMVLPSSATGDDWSAAPWNVELRLESNFAQIASFSCSVTRLLKMLRASRRLKVPQMPPDHNGNNICPDRSTAYTALSYDRELGR